MWMQNINMSRQNVYSNSQYNLVLIHISSNSYKVFSIPISGRRLLLFLWHYDENNDLTYIFRGTRFLYQYQIFTTFDIKSRAQNDVCIVFLVVNKTANFMCGHIFKIIRIFQYKDDLSVHINEALSSLFYDKTITYIPIAWKCHIILPQENQEVLH